MIKSHKRKKSTRMHGRKMGTHGTGSRKKAKGTGHKGGKGMSGSGKRADHKKTLITKLFGHNYFGKKGITSKKTAIKKENKINLRQIENNLEKYGRKTAKGWEIDLQDYKILGEGEIKEKLIIKCKKASKSAIEKVKKSGGEIVVREREEKEDVQSKKLEKIDKE